MARHPQAASPHIRAKDRGPEERWLRVPMVIAAIIAGAAAISVALINQCTVPKPKPLDTPPMQQQTHSPNNPAITDVPGSVTVIKDVAVTASGSGTAVVQPGQGSVHITNIHGISQEEHARLSQELGVTDLVLKSFFKVLEQQQPPAKTSIARCATSRSATKNYGTSSGPLLRMTLWS